MEDGLDTLTRRFEREIGSPEVGDAEVHVSDMDGTFTTLFDAISTAREFFPVNAFVDGVQQFHGYVDNPSIKIDKVNKVCRFSAMDMMRRFSRLAEILAVWDVQTTMRSHLTKTTSAFTFKGTTSGTYYDDELGRTIFHLKDFVTYIPIAMREKLGATEPYKPTSEIGRYDIRTGVNYVQFADDDRGKIPSVSTSTRLSLDMLSQRFNVMWMLDSIGRLSIVKRKFSGGSRKILDVISIDTGLMSDSFDSLHISAPVSPVGRLTSLENAGKNLVGANTNLNIANREVIFDASGTKIRNELFANLDISFQLPVDFFWFLFPFPLNAQTAYDVLYRDLFNENKSLLQARKIVEAEVKGIDVDLFDTVSFPDYVTADFHVIDMTKNLRDLTSRLVCEKVD